MFIAITVILIAGVAAIVILTTTLSYAFTRDAARGQADTQKQYTKKLAASKECDRTALEKIKHGDPICDVVERWRERREAEFPDKGPLWDRDDADAWRRNKLAKLRERLISRQLFRGIVGVVVIFLVFAAAALGVYVYFARRGPVTPMPNSMPPASIDASFPSGSSFDFPDPLPSNPIPATPAPSDFDADPTHVPAEDAKQPSAPGTRAGTPDDDDPQSQEQETDI